MQKHIDSYRKNLLSKVLLLASFCFIFSNFVAASSANQNVVRALDLAYAVKNQRVTTLDTLKTSLSITNSISLPLDAKSSQGQTVAELYLETNASGGQEVQYVIRMFGGSVAPNVDLSSILTALKPPYNIILVGVDNTGTVMKTLSNPPSPFNHFVVYIFDESGNNVSGSPMTVTESNSVSPVFTDNNITFYSYDAIFTMISQTSISYPFIINVTATTQGTAPASTQKTGANKFVPTLSDLTQLLVGHKLNEPSTSNPITTTLTGPYNLFTEINNVSQSITFENGDYVIFALSSSNLAQGKYSNVIPVPVAANVTSGSVGGVGSTEATAYWFDLTAFADLQSEVKALSGNEYVALQYNPNTQSVDLFTGTFTAPDQVNKQSEFIPSASDLQNKGSYGLAQLGNWSVKESLSIAPYNLFYSLDGTTFIQKTFNGYVVFALNGSSLAQGNYPNVISFPAGTQLQHIQIGNSSSTTATSYWWYGFTPLNTALASLSGDSYVALQYNPTTQNVDLFTGTFAAQQGQQAPTPPTGSILTTSAQLISGFHVGGWTMSQMHVDLVIGNNHYILGNKLSGYSPAGAIALANLVSSVNALNYEQWQNGIYFTIVPATNSVWVFAQDSNGKVLGSDQIPGLTTISGNVTWAGNFVSGISLPWNKSALYKAIPTASLLPPGGWGGGF